MAKRILLVDDEPLIIKGLKYSLEQEGYETDSACDGEEALSKFFSDQFDFVLLDVMLPKIDGTVVCQRIREHSNVPIIMLTAKCEQIDKILGLEYGADDYITKPFNVLEVKARIKTILRRAVSPVVTELPETVPVGGLEVSPTSSIITLRGREIRLTTKEYQLLKVFLSNKGKVFSREELLGMVWRFDFNGDARTVDVHVRRLREKLERNPAQPELLITMWGVGYYFNDKA